MREITLEELLSAGCHFGHQVTRSNPKARDFIFEARDNIHIIDLAKTKQGLMEGANFIKDLASRAGTNLVVVGTKRQAKPIVEEHVVLGDGLFYITNRWVGGLLTNFPEVSKNFKKLQDLTANIKDPEMRTKYTKKEIGLWEKNRQKLEGFYGGIEKLEKKPDALFIIDSHLEDLAVREALKTGVPTVAIVDTNANPDVVDYPIPANDDAVGSLGLIIGYIMDAWKEGRELAKERMKNEESRVKNEAEKAAKKSEKVEKKEKSPKVEAKTEKLKAKSKK